MLKLFSAGTIWRPLNTTLSEEGLKASPLKNTRVESSSAALRSSWILVLKRDAPPTGSFFRCWMLYTSLKWRIVSGGASSGGWFGAARGAIGALAMAGCMAMCATPSGEPLPHTVSMSMADPLAMELLALEALAILSNESDSRGTWTSESDDAPLCGSLCDPDDDDEEVEAEVEEEEEAAPSPSNAPSFSAVPRARSVLTATVSGATAREVSRSWLSGAVGDGGPAVARSAGTSNLARFA